MNAILLYKLHSYKDKSFELYTHYENVIKDSDSPAETFNRCIDSIKYLSEKQYDFQWVSSQSKEFGCFRKDFVELCDSVCQILGDKINDLCKSFAIITKPTKYEDYCPFSSETLVVYGKSYQPGTPVQYDGKRYRIVDSKLENTPYYSIYCNALEE